MQITKNYKTLPFSELYDIYERAAVAAVNGAKISAHQKWLEQIALAEQEYSDSHEAPSEVSFADQIPEEYVNEISIRKKAGQKAIVEEWMPRYKVETMLLPAMPQIIAHLGNKCINFAEVTTAEGQIDPKLALNRLFDFDNPWDRGLYLFLQLDSRGSYIKGQYKGPGVQYCALVPLILYAVKLHHRIPYSRWSRSGLGLVVNKPLCDAMLWEYEPFTRDQLLEARTYGLEYQSGDSKGKMRNVLSNYKLWATKGKCLEDAPELAATMLAQIWCAHPQNRHHYMVLDPKSWDVMPEPLIKDSLFVKPPPTNVVATSVDSDMPW